MTLATKLRAPRNSNPDYVFDKLSIFLNFGTAGSGETYYFDDVTFVGAADPVDPVAGSELIVNGDFKDGAASWVGADGAITAYFALVDTTSTNVWEKNLSQVMTLVADSAYTVKFKAKSSIERTMLAGLGLNSGDYANVAEEVSLTTEWKEFTLEQTTTGFGDDNSRILFDMGGAQGGQVWIDDVSVVTADGTELVSNGDFQNGSTGWTNDSITSYFALVDTSSANVWEKNSEPDHNFGSRY